jgi:hypothetical protein
MTHNQLKSYFTNSISINKLVVTNDREKALSIFKEIYKNEVDKIERYVENKREICIFYKNGGEVRWCEAVDSARGRRWHKLIIDSNVNIDFFENVILPMQLSYPYTNIEEILEII